MRSRVTRGEVWVARKTGPLVVVVLAGLLDASREAGGCCVDGVAVVEVAWLLATLACVMARPVSRPKASGGMSWAAGKHAGGRVHVDKQSNVAAGGGKMMMMMMMLFWSIPAALG